MLKIFSVLKAKKNSAPENNIFIGNIAFIERCRALRKSKHLLEINGISAVSFEKFYFLDRQLYEKGAREPSLEEFSLLNELEGAMAPQITQQIRTQLLARSARRSVGAWSAFSLFAAVTSFLLASIAILTFQEKNQISHILLLPLYIVFSLSLGFLGSTASISLSSLSAKSDDKFDLTDADLVRMRIVSGGLFALCLAIPWTPVEFFNFAVASTNFSGDFSNLHQAFKFILPFLFGFSTSVVLLMISRITEGIETMLGFSKKNI